MSDYMKSYSMNWASPHNIYLFKDFFCETQLLWNEFLWNATFVKRDAPTKSTMLITNVKEIL